MEKESVSKFSQLKAMVIRNITLKKRSGRKTVAECVVPIWFLAFLVLLKSLIPDPNYNPILTEPADTPIGIDFALNQLNENTSYTIYLVPNTSEIQNFADRMQDYWSELSWPGPGDGPFQPLGFVFLETEKDLEAIYADKNLTIPVELAVVFDGDPSVNMSYTIRNHPDTAPLALPSRLYATGDACRNPNSSAIYPEYNAFGSCPINSYFFSNFLVVQSLVEGTWLKMKMPDVEIPVYLKQMTMQLFPKGPYVDETSLLVLRYLVPFYMVLSLSQFILYLLTVIVGEKEKKIKEGLRMMGLNDSVYWLSWFLVYLVFVIVLTLVATGILYGMKVFQNSNVGLIYLLFILYDISVLMLAFLMTTFFDKARVAGIFGAMAVSFLNLFYYIQVATGDATPKWLYWFLALISPTGFALGMDKALLLEITTPTGVTVDTLWAGPGLPLAGSYIMLSFDIVFYFFLAYYLDNVLPSEYGAKRAPYFFLLPSFWRKSPKTINLDGQINNGFSGYKDTAANEDIEAIPESLIGKEALKIRGLTKTFKPFGRPNLTAVNGLNLDVYEGQITAILGHNGAGKTTLFNMLTGMTAPSKGSAYLYGYDLSDSNQLEEIRRMTGVCPQHDVLFDLLTPGEHLAFYAKIRGVREDLVNDEVEKVMKDIDLTSKANTLAGKLSGGQKRKLSIGIALIGDPKIVFLDEPTAGVDPYSRRHLWTLLQKRKANKVILLTTHFMDEADLLADRKAIVSKGKLRCMGSSLFLKNRFGLGYHLTFVLNESFRDTEAIRKVVESFVASAKLNRHYGRELSYVLPRQHVSSFPPLFSKLESLVNGGEASVMGFNSYGVSMTTLEEVFLKLGEEAELAEQAEELATKTAAKKSNNVKTKRSLSSDSIPEVNTDEQETNEDNPNSTWELLNNLDVPIRESHKGQTLRALLKIRGMNMARDPMAVFFQVIMPVLFAALGIWLGTLATERTVEVKRSFTFDLYRDQLNSSALLYSETGDDSEMSAFWSKFAQFNGFQLEHYSGDFPDILELNLKNKSSHWAASDTRDTYSLDTLNSTWYNGSLPDVVQNPFPYKHTRLRFNDTLIHTPPLMINSISNTLLQMNNKAENISLSVYPLPYTTPPGSGFDPGSFTSAMFIGMLFVLAPSALACEIVLDREIHAKNLLRVNGLSFGQYFGSFFIVLGSMMVTTCILILLLIFAFHLQALITPVAISLLAILYILFCPAGILFATCCSYLFKTLESTQSIFPNVSTFVGFIPFLVVIMCDMFQLGGSTELATGLHIGFCFIDVLYIPYGILYYVNRIYYRCLLTASIGQDPSEYCNHLAWADYMTPEIVCIFVALFIHIAVYFVLLIIIDVKHSGGSARDAFSCFAKSKSKESQMRSGDFIAEEYNGAGDSDVKAENLRVQKILYEPRNKGEETPVVLIHGLHKKYKKSGDSKRCGKGGENPATANPAVNYMSFAVQSGEVFGLLGHNGAGKTTTMKVITAEEAPTHGRVQVDGHDIVSNQSDAFQALGYCPQHDALWRNITVREHMEAYASIRGIVPSHIPRIVDLFLRGLQIEHHADKYAKNCSGGTRRKLSYALSMLGRPAIVLMDEPSTGMDPQSKRFLWNTISASFQGKRGAILTTHSMEEADALCSRLGIMVKGELRCMGTGQHLKNRYGSGYLLELKLKSLGSETSGSASLADVDSSRSERKENLTTFINSLFTSAHVQESFEDRIIFGIAQDNISSLSETFQALEEAREKLSIEEYSFSQTTLEQVFIKFAHEQEDVSE
ncbi:ABC-type organic anion transporter ABCA8-like [Daphnia pulex]|uniref:ABC-type organic anion transporter ABCA8-like n=1 Tax=Daphnia pulex TaxID=6669 RepID=UPI001EDD4E11|nr:ABC-type organic anion transporter ABCA8-like [Daphnia pulex]